MNWNQSLFWKDVVKFKINHNHSQLYSSKGKWVEEKKLRTAWINPKNVKLNWSELLMDMTKEGALHVCIVNRIKTNRNVAIFLEHQISRVYNQNWPNWMWCSGIPTWLPIWRIQVPIFTHYWMHIFSSFFFFPIESFINSSEAPNQGLFMSGLLKMPYSGKMKYKQGKTTYYSQPDLKCPNKTSLAPSFVTTS